MSTTTLLKAISEFLGQERKLLLGHGSTSGRAKLDTAAAELEGSIADYIRERSRPGTIKSILVAVNASQPAEWALDEAVRLAEVLEARVSLIHVLVRPKGLAPDLTVDLDRKSVKARGHEILRELAGRVPAPYLDEQILAEGSADRQIVAAAQKTEADLIIIGTHGRGAVGRFLLGSVADAVVRHSPCPVLTVNHPRDGAGPEPYALDGSEAESLAVQAQ